MTKASSYFLLISLHVLTLSVAFLPHTKIDHVIPASRTHKFSMYFDDISRSRYTVPWNQDDGQNNLNFSTARGGRGGFRTNANGDQMESYSEQKLDALHKSLYGYDPQAASRLSTDEVEQDVRYWYENSDIGRVFFQTKDFESNNDLVVCTEKNPIACMSFLWEYIHMYTNRLGNDNDNQHETMMIIFPYCPAFYNYDKMEKWFNALERCGDLCSVFTKDHDVSHFHPTYKNEPKMLSLIRHSPFPAFALHEKRNKSHAHKELLSIKDESQIDFIFGKVFDDGETSIAGKNRMERGIESDYMEENMDSIFHDYIDQRRNDFEALFNSDAAISPIDGELNVGVEGNMDYSGNKFIGRENSDQVVIAMTKDWMLKSGKDKERMNNKALQFSGSINDRWILTNSTAEEDLYKEIWNAIDQLQNHYHESLCEERSVISAIFITRKYSIFNANRFKRFAISINGVLKEFTDGEVFLELFHPEYVGKKSSQSRSRRSPFPTLQICRRCSPSE